MRMRTLSYMIGIMTLITFNSVIIFTALAIDIFLVIRYNIMLNISKLTYKVGKRKGICSTNHGFYLFLELVVCSICMPPGADFEFSGYMLNGRYTYSLSMILYTICMIKTSYLIGRIYFHYSVWRYRSSKQISAACHNPINTNFEVKAELKYHPVMITSL